MATNLNDIQLTDEQMRTIAQLAKLEGKPWNEVLEERLRIGATTPENGTDTNEEGPYLQGTATWLAKFEQWINSRRSYNPTFDDSREGIYSDRS
jgi:hypothetical protein